MPSRRFMPYPAFSDLELTCRVQGESSYSAPATIDLRQIVQSRSELPPMELEVSIPAQQAVKLIPSGEDWEQTVGSGVIISSVSSRTRELTRLEPAGPFNWKGSVQLERDHVFRSASLEPVLFRKTLSPKTENKARHKGARLAWGHSISLLFDNLPEEGTNWLSMEWANFADHVALEPYQELLFLLDLDPPGELPVLRLNRGVNGLYSTLTGGTTSDHRRVRDAIGAMIAVQANTQLVLHLTAAITDLAKETTSPDIEGLLEELLPWEREMAQFWAARVYPESDRDEAVTRLITDALDPVTVGDLNTRLVAEAQKRGSVPDAFYSLSGNQPTGDNQ